jgi:hypothetical protein
MLDDGAEQGNVFERNLGAVGHGVDIPISDDESDGNPCTFWITNPQNTWIASHSFSQGLQTYPQTGYRPVNLAVFENHKSYRNRLSGVFFHAGG